MDMMILFPEPVESQMRQYSLYILKVGNVGEAFRSAQCRDSLMFLETRLLTNNIVAAGVPHEPIHWLIRTNWRNPVPSRPHLILPMASKRKHVVAASDQFEPDSDDLHATYFDRNTGDCQENDL